MRVENNKQRIKYIMYCRKSSDTEDRQVQSISDQVRVLKELGDKQGLQIVDVLEESMSAKEPGRPIFDDLIRRIKSGEANGILVWKLNRLSRNPIDGGMIGWLLQEGTIKHIQTSGRGYYPEDNVIMMQVELGMATQFVRDLSVDVKRGIRSREKRGLPNGVASIGFMNDLSQEPGKRGWLVDEERFGIIKQLLEMYATAKYSLREITTIANDDMGLRTPQRKKQGGKKLSVSYVAGTVLKNPVNAGFFYSTDGTKCELDKNLPRMIDTETYWKIQKIMGDRGRTRPHANRLLFSYTGVIRCGGCGGSVTAENKYQLICPECKKKFSYPNKKCCPECGSKIDKMKNPKYLHYIYYHCNRKKNPHCKQGSVQEVQIDDYLSEYFSKNLKISEDLSKWCLKNLDLLENQNEEDEYERKKSIQGTLDKKKNEYKELILMKTKNLIDEEEFTFAKESLKEEISALERKINYLKNTDHSKTEQIRKCFSLATGIDQIFKNGNSEEKKQVMTELGSNLVLKDKKLNIHNAKKYQILINGLHEIKGEISGLEPMKTLNTSNKNGDFVGMRSTLLWGWDSNPQPLD